LLRGISNPSRAILGTPVRHSDGIQKGAYSCAVSLTLAYFTFMASVVGTLSTSWILFLSFDEMMKPLTANIKPSAYSLRYMTACSGPLTVAYRTKPCLIPLLPIQVVVTQKGSLGFLHSVR